MKKYIIFAHSVLVLMATALGSQSAFAGPGSTSGQNHITTYKVHAKNARLIRRVTGPVFNSINGVPAEPVDSFDWSGSEVRAIKGEAKMKIDPVSNTGEITAKWADEYGQWTYTQTKFSPPPHPTGVRIGPSLGSVIKIMGDPVTTNVYLHGDTGAGGPVIPTEFNLIATWGPAKVTLNGMPFDNPFDGPAPMWVGHTMLSEGVRDDEGVVRNESGGLYTAMKSGEGAVIPEEMAFHIVFHDMPGPDKTGNFPPPLSFFYHISFGKLEVEIKHSN